MMRQQADTSFGFRGYLSEEKELNNRTPIEHWIPIFTGMTKKKKVDEVILT